jgi:D-aminoacyl-tRNA deacylase
MHILFTKENPASFSIARMLITEHGFAQEGKGRWRKGETLLLDTSAPTILEVPTDFDTDTLIVLSTHRSKIDGRMLTAHVPGNWGVAEMGGEDKTLNVAPTRLLKAIITGLKKEGDRIGWPVSLEADHHGPLSKKPILFVEIGNGEKQWEDKEAARAVANAVASAIGNTENKTETSNQTNLSPVIVAFGVGGGHYPKTFTKLVLETDIAFGHILPKHSIEALDENLFKQAIEKSVEKVDKVLIAKDETNLIQKDKIRKMAERFGIPCELV